MKGVGEDTKARHHACGVAGGVGQGVAGRGPTAGLISRTRKVDFAEWAHNNTRVLRAAGHGDGPRA